MLNVRMDYQGDIQIDIISASGQRITSRQVNAYAAGQTLEMDLDGFTDGIYFIRLVSEHFSVTKTFVVNK